MPAFKPAENDDRDSNDQNHDAYNEQDGPDGNPQIRAVSVTICIIDAPLVLAAAACTVFADLAVFAAAQMSQNAMRAHTLVYLEAGLTDRPKLVMLRQVTTHD